MISVKTRLTARQLKELQPIMEAVKPGKTVSIGQLVAIRDKKGDAYLYLNVAVIPHREAEIVKAVCDGKFIKLDAANHEQSPDSAIRAD